MPASVLLMAAGILLVITGNGRRFQKPDFVGMVRNTPTSYKSLVARDVRVCVCSAPLLRSMPIRLGSGPTAVEASPDTSIPMPGSGVASR
jgi:hypothetical protein